MLGRALHRLGCGQAFGLSFQRRKTIGGGGRVGVGQGYVIAPSSCRRSRFQPPVTNFASSEASQTAAQAISLGLPMVPI